MKFHDMQKPLVQSALVLLAILVVIGFVAGSGAESFLGGIMSIFKGVIYTVLYAFALLIGLIFSVILLIAIFLGAVSLYSSEKAKEMYAYVRQRATDLYLSWTKRSLKLYDSKDASAEQKSTDPPPSSQQETTQFATASSLASLEQKVLSEVKKIQETVGNLSTSNASLDASFVSLQETVSSFPGTDILQRVAQLEIQQEKTESTLNECLKKIETISNTAALEEENKRLGKEIKTVQGEVASVANILEELRTSFSERGKTPPEEEAVIANEEEYRIFAYLEKETDKKQFMECVAKAVEKEMTYAEIDSFLTESLPKKIDGIIKDHPSLTKDYIRACKNV
jgi:hypothetical protein